MKVWTWNTFLEDHLYIITKVPKLYDAYVGPTSIKATDVEGIMLTINAVNNWYDKQAANLH